MTKIVTCQPNNKYFVWQTEIQILNLKTLGFPLEEFYPVIGRTNSQINFFSNLIKLYPEVSWRVFDDTRIDRSYIPSLKPHLLSKLIGTEQFSEFFLIDSDVIFRELPRFSQFTKPNTWYLSDTSYYMDSKYISSKGSGLFEDMCRVVGVDPNIVCNTPTGGAQWYIKGTNRKFWERVEKVSVQLYKFLIYSEPFYREKWSIETGHEVDKYHPIQSWCSEMWSILWSGLMMYNIIVAEELNFSWATDPIDKWVQTRILHNAGVTIDRSDTLFYKGSYINGLNESFDLTKIDKTRCSYIYSLYVNRVLKEKYKFKV